MAKIKELDGTFSKLESLPSSQTRTPSAVEKIGNDTRMSPLGARSQRILNGVPHTKKTGKPRQNKKNKRAQPTLRASSSFAWRLAASCLFFSLLLIDEETRAASHGGTSTFFFVFLGNKARAGEGGGEGVRGAQSLCWWISVDAILEDLTMDFRHAPG